MSVGEPLTSGVRREAWSTTQPDEAYEVMRAAYTDHTPQMSGEFSSFRFARATRSAGTFAVDRMTFSAEYLGRSAPATDQLIVSQPLGDAALTITCERRATSGPVMLTPTWSRFAAQWSGIDLRLTTLDAARVARRGAETSGLAAHEVTFAGVEPLTPALGRYWATITAHVHDGVLADDLDPPPLLLAEAFRALATAALVVFPNSTQRDRPGPAQHAEPATVRRAVDFIDAHATEDLDITRIAEAAGIGPRGLQAAFRRHRGTSPLAYLRRVRLEGAHRDLLAADPTQGDTVSAIAARWGFGNAGRFSGEYRAAFHRPPGETLRR